MARSIIAILLFVTLPLLVKAVWPVPDSGSAPELQMPGKEHSADAEQRGWSSEQGFEYMKALQDLNAKRYKLRRGMTGAGQIYLPSKAEARELYIKYAKTLEESQRWRDRKKRAVHRERYKPRKNLAEEERSKMAHGPGVLKITKSEYGIWKFAESPPRLQPKVAVIHPQPRSHGPGLPPQQHAKVDKTLSQKHSVI